MKNQLKGFIIGFISATIIMLSITSYASDLYKNISVKINSINLMVNGIKSTAPTLIWDGRTYIQARDVANLLNKNIFWDSGTNTVFINDKLNLTNSEVIESRIDGDFEGWEGDTIFKLQNGQIWQQDDISYTYHYSYSPEVTIYKSGSRYKMKVDGVDDTIYVKKLK